LNSNWMMDDRLDGAPPQIDCSTTIPVRGALFLSRQRFTRAYIVRRVHVAFVEFMASRTGTLYNVAYLRRDAVSGTEKKTKTILNTAY
jgi:hypothetical protein